MMTYQDEVAAQAQDLDEGTTEWGDYGAVEGPTTFEIPAWRLDEFRNRVEKANRRLQRAGAEHLFHFDYEDFEKTEAKRGTGRYSPDLGIWLEDPIWITTPWVRATLDGDFELAAGDYTFVASLVAEEAGYTVHTAPGQNLDGWARPAVDDIHCDHCGTVRNRLNIYIVRNNETGELMQLGSSCIRPFLGMSPSGLWALTFTETLGDLEADDDGYGNSGFGQRDLSTEIDTILAIAWAYSNHGRAYVSTKAAEFRDELATVEQVRRFLWNPPRPPKAGSRNYQAERREYEDYLAKVEEVAVTRADDELLKAIKDSAYTGTREGTDYGDNLRTILAAESGRVSGRNVGITASLVQVYAREQELVEERAKQTPPAKGFAAPVKTRMRNFTIKVSTVREFQRESFSYYGGTETATMIVGRDADEHVIKWTFSGTCSYEPGDVIKMEAATVKAHGEFKGTDQTVIFRGIIDDFEERAKQLLAAIEANDGHEFEAKQKWEAEFEEDGTKSLGRGRWVTIGYDEDAPLADRYLKSKAEKKRFATWRKEKEAHK